MTPDANCPDAETLAAWYDHGLPPADHAQIDSHVSTCDRCQALVATLVRADAPPTVPGREWTWVSWRWLAPITAVTAAAVLWAVVRPSPPAPAEPSAPASLSARAEPSPAPAPAPAPVPERRVEPQSAAVPSVAAPAVPPGARAEQKAAAPAQPAESNEVRRDQRASENIAAAPPVTPPVTTQSAPAAAPAAAARLMQADALAPPLEIVSTDPAIRWRIRGAIVERTADAGVTWTAQPTGTSVPLTAGASASPDVCWIVGGNGTVVRTTDGRTWQTLVFPERIDLIRVEAASADSATVITADARRFTTDDGGATWKPGGLQEF